MNRPIICIETETVIKNLPANKCPGPDGNTGGAYQRFKEDLKSILLKLLPKVAEEGALLNSLYVASIILIPKPDKEITHTQNENYRPISLMNTNEKILNKPSNNALKRSHHDKVGFTPRDARSFQNPQIDQCDTLY